MTSLVAKDENPNEIARGLHIAVVKRVLSMLKRVSQNGPVVFTGGVVTVDHALQNQYKLLKPVE